MEDLEEHRQRRQESSRHCRAAREAAAIHQYGAKGEAANSQRQDSRNCSEVDQRLYQTRRV